MDDLLRNDNNEQDVPQTDGSADDNMKSELDDKKLSDDFVIGQDFFIDSSEADLMLAEEEKKKAPAKRKGRKSTSRSCLTSVIWMAAILIIALSAAFVLLYLGTDYLGVSMDADSAIDVEIVIEEGTSAKQIAEQLHDAGIIKSTLFFRFYAKSGGYDSRFQNGIYRFCKQDSYEDIVEALTEQGLKASEVKVTIPEGWTVDQIAARLEENGVCSASDFKTAVNEATKEKYNFDFMDGVKPQTAGVHYKLEGYLFPDTYYFYNTNDKSGAEMAIRKMLSAMDQKITDEMVKRAEELGYSMHDILTLASVIEMESSVADYATKQKVSAVFHNRLNDWEQAKLQSDPTREYPYNTDRYDTYEIIGLAPGAYCSPSIESINAALWPDEGCNAYYFVTDNEMNFYFNETLNGHNSTISKLKSQGKWYVE